MVNTGGVVGAGVEKHSGTWLGTVQISDHAIDIETLGLLVEVFVLTDLDTSGLENLVVISPSGVAHIESARSELGKELSDDAQGTSSRQSLDGSDSNVTNPWAVEAEEDTLGSLAEFSQTINWQVLLIKSRVSHNLGFGLAHDGEDVGLAVVVAVSTNTEVDLLGVLVILEAGGKTKDMVGGGHGHVIELIVQGAESLHDITIWEVYYYFNPDH